jgi:hypothetical protein
MKLDVVLIPYFDKENLNHHMYTESTVDEIIKKFNDRSIPMYGHLGFPETPEIITDFSHIISKMWKENNQLLGSVTVLDTPKGEILKELLNTCAQLVCRLSCTGTINDKIVNIKDNLKFNFIPITADSF